MGLTEDKIVAKMRKLDKEVADIYERYAPKETQKCMAEFDKLDEKLHQRLAVRPLNAVEIDMAIIDYKKSITEACVRYR